MLEAGATESQPLASGGILAIGTSILVVGGGAQSME